MIFCGGHFEIEKKQARLGEITQIEAMEGFWDDAPNAGKIQKEKSVLEEVTKTYLHLKQLYDDFDILFEFAMSENDESSAIEGIEAYKNFLIEFNLAEQKVLLADELDPNNAIVTVNSGAGGTESCDWAYMLLRMVIRWAESKNLKFKS